MPLARDLGKYEQMWSRFHHVRLVYTKIIDCLDASILWKKNFTIRFRTSLIFSPDIAVPITARIERDGETGQSLRRAETHVRILRNFGATSSDDNYGKIVIYVRTVLARHGGKRRVPDSRYSPFPLPPSPSHPYRESRPFSDVANTLWNSAAGEFL